MKPSILRAAAMATILLAAGAASRGQTLAPRLSFEDRVRAQEAIDRVYYSHQLGATRPFEQAVPRDVLEKKVRVYLKQSAALEQLWKSPVTAESLSRELERIARDTRHPDWLHEIYAVLHHDPFLVRETFARPVLVDRLARSFFPADQRIHSAARQEAESLRDGLMMESLAPPASYEGGLGLAGRFSPEAQMCRLPRSIEEPQIGSVEEEQDAFVIRAQTDDGAIVATGGVSYSVPKMSWSSWWAGIEPALREESILPVGSLADPLPVPGPGAVGTGVCIPNDTWDNGILDDPPDPRRSHSAVWTGREMIVWGPDDSGNRYDPLTDTWKSVTKKNAPRGGFGANVPGSAVWTGQEMIVWNGTTGGSYDPRTDTWRPMSPLSAPAPDEAQIWGEAVWTGKEMIVWSGSDQAQGGRYDPASDTWKPVSPVGAPAYGGAAVWTGKEMLAFGGAAVWTGMELLGEGARYDPASDTWSPMSSVNAPPGQYKPVWTGSALIAVTFVMFDEDPGPWRRYDPASDTWAPLSVPALEYNRFSAVWTGNEVVAWGGTTDCSCETNTGVRYDPATNRWATTSLTNAPSPRVNHTAVWTGREMIIWGGGIFGGAGLDDQQFSSGGRYDPETDTWKPTSTTNGGPGPQWNHAAVWTGNFMALWNWGSGGLYDPLADSWRSISTQGAPFLYQPQAVWTGDEMIVWGEGRGGRYDPLMDVWRPVSTEGAPVNLVNAATVWTGRELIVVGFMCKSTPGICESGVHGARYEPATDTWRSMAALDATFFAWYQIPLTAVWTGREMIIVGDQPPTIISGRWWWNAPQAGRYDPATDTWTPLRPTIPTLDEPFSWRSNVVWTGNELIMLRAESIPARVVIDRYDPELDLWSSGSSAGIPMWDSFTAVWTGREAIVWSFRNGGRYDPVTDTWRPVSTIDAPYWRYSHSTVWTGREMIVWGGLYPIEPIIPLATGGRYFPYPPPDEDLDGFTACSGDCDESSASVNPSAVELPGNLIDENCDGAVECSPCSAWRNQGQYVACVARSVEALEEAGLLTREDGRSLVASAARSDVGKNRSVPQGCAP